MRSSLQRRVPLGIVGIVCTSLASKPPKERPERASALALEHPRRHLERMVEARVVVHLV